MQKEVSVTIRIEPDLRDSFKAAAERAHRPAAQVLRELMRDYVGRESAAPPPQPISNAERRRREQALNFAIASVGLEGFAVSDAYRAAAQRFVSGEIEFAALTELVKTGKA